MPLTTVPELLIGALAIPNRAGTDLEVTYDDAEGASLLRMADGSVKKITIWQGKLRVSVSGSGFLPPGLQPGILDYSATHVVKLPTPRAVYGATVAITIPAARRTDLSAQAIGVWFNEEYDAGETPVVSVVTDLVTLTSVAGATGYQVLYWPQITAYVERDSESIQRRSATSRWKVNIIEA